MNHSTRTNCNTAQSSSIPQRESCAEPRIEPSLDALRTPVAHLHADPANVRTHSTGNLDAIRASLVAFGQQKPIVVDQGGVCLAGNGTLMAARSLGWTHIAALRTTLTGTDARAYAIADNRTTDLSQWDEQALAQQLAGLQNDESFDHLATGFSDEAIEQTISDAMGIDAPAPDAPLPDEVSLNELHQVLVACDDETAQRELYERLSQEGYACRVLTL